MADDKVIDLEEQARVRTHTLHIVIQLPASVTLNELGEVITTQVHSANIGAAKFKGKPVKAKEHKEIEKRREQLTIVVLTQAMKAIVENYNERKRQELQAKAVAAMEQLKAEEVDAKLEAKPSLIEKVTGYFSKKEE